MFHPTLKESAKTSLTVRFAFVIIKDEHNYWRVRVTYEEATY